VLLVVEQGNTNTVFALWKGGDWQVEQRVATRTDRTDEAYAELLRPLWQGASRPRRAPVACLISSVVPAAVPQLRRIAHEHFGTAPLVVGDELIPKLDIQLPDPCAVGTDRLVNAVAGFKAFGGPLLIVDSGTATKFDLVSASGAFLGGLIAPGLWSGAAALVEQCALLSPTNVESAPIVVGRDTSSALRSGLYWGHLSMIEGLIRRIRDEASERLMVIATGGVIDLFSQTITGVDHSAPRLTQQGLVELWTRHRLF
jgi:type III pantothenate kinase